MAASAFEGRLNAVQQELAALRAEFPDLNARFSGLKSPRAREWQEAAKRPGSAPIKAAVRRQPKPPPKEPPLPTGPAPFVHRLGSGTRPRNLPAPGSHAVGYRAIATRTGAHRSTPAFSFRPKIVLSSRVDPLMPDDDIPGPGTYDTGKY